MGKRRTSKWNSKLFRKFGPLFFQFLGRLVPFGITAGIIGFMFINVRAMLYADPYFQASQITVFPSGVLNDPELRFLEREVRGKSLIEINLKAISQSLERNPNVKRAEVDRIFPDQLNIFLTTRLPFIQVQLKQGGPYYLIASDQLILGIENEPRADLMALEDFSSERKTYSAGTLYSNKYFQNLFGIFQSLTLDPLLRTEAISKLAIDPAGNVSIVLKDGIELRAGGRLMLSDATRAVLNSLLKSESRSDILYIDIRYRDIIVKKKSQV